MKVNKEFNVKYLRALVPADMLLYLDFRIGDNDFEGIDEVFEKYPKLKYERDGEEFLLFLINVDSGEVENWPKNCQTDFYTFKVTDCGTYELLDENQNELFGYTGYVPTCFGDKYGDYFEFEIDDNGYIVDFKFDEDDFDEIKDKVDDDE